MTLPPMANSARPSATTAGRSASRCAADGNGSSSPVVVSADGSTTLWAAPAALAAAHSRAELYSRPNSP